MSKLTVPRTHIPRPQQGFTLVELMIALVLGLLVVLAATAMLLSSRSTYRTQDEGTRLQESARFGLELTNRIVRMAGYTNFGDYTELPKVYKGANVSVTDPNIIGTNNQGGAPNNSDTLTIRYFGAGVAASGPNPSTAPILNCQGTEVLEAGIGTVIDDRAVNTFYVATETDGEPALFCSTTALASGGQALIRGVESFQVLYGVAAYAPGVDPDDGLPPATISYRRADQMGTVFDAWGNNDWDYVRDVKIAMLMRSATGARTDLDGATYSLFGPNYPFGGDPGTRFVVSGFTNIERTRIRRVVSSTIALRNRTSPWPSAGS